MGYIMVGKTTEVHLNRSPEFEDMLDDIGHYMRRIYDGLRERTDFPVPLDTPVSVRVEAAIEKLHQDLSDGAIKHGGMSKWEKIYKDLPYTAYGIHVFLSVENVRRAHEIANMLGNDWLFWRGKPNLKAIVTLAVFYTHDWLS